MNTQRIKVIAFVGLLIALPVIFWWQMQPTAEQKALMAQAQQSQATVQGAPAPGPGAGAAATADTTAAPAGSAPAGARRPAPSTPGGPGSPGGTSVFQRSSVNLDELLARVKEVDFVYDNVALPRNPMHPLVGSSLPREMQQQGGAEPSNTQVVVSIARNMHVTGIVWDENDPIAVVEDEVVHRGYEFPTGVVVEDIEPTRVVLRAGESQIPIDLEER